MTQADDSFGWEYARNGGLLRKVLGEFPSFHDASVRSFCMRRARRTVLDDSGKPLPPGCDRDLVDLTLEIVHNRFGPKSRDGDLGYIITIELRNISKAEIDIDAMIEEAWIMDIKLEKIEGGLIRFDLNPNIGLDVVAICSEVVVESIRPYDREAQ
ncbi:MULTISPECIES: immunity 50 family protein [Burkholderia cepacia complex]|uniref:immunity 50 family protein n=1 Tax=Burkholderia cepacia complex TaxID=87882 RepID=UPI0021C1A601|nr:MULTISPECIES: immunity 50 family protein [Burkholderia cepacia complex]MCW3609166.1 immunity 50 family protein [Burkholderia cenocepacia]MCW5189891.1 immunity 50 family protein [Burkholderia cenocepacia]